MIGQEGTTRRAEGAVARVELAVQDPALRAYDKASGAVVGEVAAEGTLVAQRDSPH
jgi:hypothetical protein